MAVKPANWLVCTVGNCSDVVVLGEIGAFASSETLQMFFAKVDTGHQLSVANCAILVKMRPINPSSN